MIDPKILARVKKLLTLAEGGANVNESAAALAAAQRLMTEHAIEQAMLDTASDNPEGEEQVVSFNDPDDALTKGRKYVAWKGRLAMALCEANGCHVWKHGGYLQLVGRPTEVATVRYLFAFCEREITRLVAAQGRGHGRTWYNNYRIGCVEAIHSALLIERNLLQAQLREGATGMSLVVVNDAIAKVDRRSLDAARFAKKKHGLRQGRSSKSRYNSNARERGRRDGATINLGAGKGLGSGSRNQLGE